MLVTQVLRASARRTCVTNTVLRLYFVPIFNNIWAQKLPLIYELTLKIQSFLCNFIQADQRNSKKFEYSMTDRG